MGTFSSQAGKCDNNEQEPCTLQIRLTVSLELSADDDAERAAEERLLEEVAETSR
jgi:hypothetical protein